MDGVYANGKDLGLRPRLNTAHGRRHARRAAWPAWCPANIAAANFRIDISRGR